MFKLVVLFAFVAITVAKPSGVWVESPIVQTYSAPVIAAVPSAVSHTYRKDIISEPAVVAYSSPVVQKYVAAPVVQKYVAAPVVQKYVAAPVALPAAVSHSYRSDIISKPIVATPVVQKYIAEPIALPAAISHSYRSDIVSKPVVAAYAAPWSYGHGW